MVTSSNIRAGGASVEIVADSRKLDSGLREAEAKLRAYNQRVRQLNKEATAAAKAGDQGQAIRLGMTARELDKHSDRVRERASTLSQGDDARSALAQRLASFKAGKAALLSDQNDLEERLFASTHSYRDVALRDLDKHFNAMRAKYAGNAAMLTQIEATAAAERARVIEDTTPKIGKREMKKLAGGAASMVAAGAGPEANMAVMMGYLAAGTPIAVPLIGAAAAVAVLAAGFKSAAAAVEAVEKSVKAWGDQLTRTTNLIAEAGSRLRPQNGNEQTRSEMQRLREEQQTVHGTDTSMSWFKRIFVGNAPQEWAGAEKSRQLDMLQKRLLELSALADREAQAFKAMGPIKSAHDVNQARIDAMDEGPEKSRQALSERHGFEQQESRWKNYVQPGSVDMAALAQKQNYERLALERQFQEELRRDQVSAEEARINATSTGFARELALLQAKHRSEVDEYDRAGKDKTAVLQRQKSEEQALYNRRSEQVGEIQDQLQNATKAATGGVGGSREVEWLGIEKQLRELGLMEDAIKRIKGLWQQKNAAEDNKAVLDQIDELNLKLAVATGKMSEADAEMAKLAKEHPEASAANLDKLKALKEQTDLAEFVKGELDKIKTPAEQFKDYRARTDKAVSQGLLSPEQQQALLQSKMAEMMGGLRSVGGFNVTAINQMIGGGSVAERTAKAAEDTAKNTRKLVDGQGSGQAFA